MKIAILRERYNNESRVAITPDIVKLFIKDNFQVFIENNAGLKAGFDNQQYISAGAKISNVPLEIVSDADIILKVQPTPENDPINELIFAKKGAIIIGLLNPGSNKQLISEYCEKQITALALELLPRITKAQSMDVLSSQSNLAGYRSVIEAAYHYSKAFPMMMTAAGTILAAKVLVLGAGVAGLQAIATAKRLGAVVSGYDVRANTKEQVESLGAKFINNIEQTFENENKGGYASELSSEYKKLQANLLDDNVSKNDIIITTAQIPNKPAPILVTKEMISKMRYGSIIIDLAAGTGGNTEITMPDQTVELDGVKVIGYSNMPSLIPFESSKLYAKNLYNFIKYSLSSGKLDTQDDLIKPMLLTFEGKIHHGL
jgi:NAD(P) transhydrogenase subunit alpha